MFTSNCRQSSVTTAPFNKNSGTHRITDDGYAVGTLCNMLSLITRKPHTATDFIALYNIINSFTKNLIRHIKPILFSVFRISVLGDNVFITQVNRRRKTSAALSMINKRDNWRRLITSLSPIAYLITLFGYDTVANLGKIIPEVTVISTAYSQCLAVFL